MFNQMFQMRIQNQLNNEGFCEVSDFLISYRNQENFVFAEIRYKYINGYFFVMKFTVNTDNSTLAREMEVHSSPGLVLKQDTRSIPTGNLEVEMGGWIGRLKNEIKNLPWMKKLESQEEEIGKIFSAFNQISEDFFTKEEGEKIKQDVEKLKEFFLRKMPENEKKTEVILNEIETLKQDLVILNKKNWFLKFSTRIQGWSEKFSDLKILSEAKSFFLVSGNSSKSKEVIQTTEVNESE